MAEPIRVVIIEDEAPIRRFLVAGTKATEVTWMEAGTGADGIHLVARHAPNVVLLDLGLPDMDGLEVLRSLREWTDVPIIILTARGKESEKVAALDAGADDYVTKPFSLSELMARVRVAHRHAAKGADAVEPVIEEGDLYIDFVQRIVRVRGQEVRLTPIEYRLLSLLVRHAGKVVTHRQLLKEAWGPGDIESTHTLRVHMGAIRQKLEEDTAKPKIIRTETGVGYRLLTAEQLSIPTDR